MRSLFGAALRPLQDWRPVAFVIFLTLFVLAPASTKIAGATWIFLLLVGISSYLNRKKAAVHDDPQHEMLEAVFETLLMGCIAAALLKIAGQLYWSDNGRDRHFELYSIFAVVATRSLIGSWAFNSTIGRQISLASFLTAGVALSVTLFSHDREFPANAIPWGMSALFICNLLLALACKREQSIQWILISGAGAIMASIAVIQTGVRSAYLGLAVLICIAGWRISARFANGKDKKKLLAAALIVLCFLGIFGRTLLQYPVQRVLDAWVELQEVANTPTSTVTSVVTSVGIRLYLWKRSLESIPTSPWVGFGKEGRKQLERSWGEESGPQGFRSPTHVHNEYLHSFLEYGVLGFSSALVFIITLMVIAWRLKHISGVGSQFFLGLALVHALGGLTNVNTLHNYYGTMLGLVMALGLLLSAVRGCPLTR